MSAITYPRVDDSTFALEGKDVIIRARTGKTAAFGLPTLDKIRTEENTIQALVIAPTRELAAQSQEERLFWP